MTDLVAILTKKENRDKAIKQQEEEILANFASHYIRVMHAAPG
jgi:hypothetical protein